MDNSGRLQGLLPCCATKGHLFVEGLKLLPGFYHAKVRMLGLQKLVLAQSFVDHSPGKVDGFPLLVALGRAAAQTANGACVSSAFGLAPVCLNASVPGAALLMDVSTPSKDLSFGERLNRSPLGWYVRGG